MPAKRAPTDPAQPVVVNVNRTRTEDLPSKKRNGNGITVAMLGAIVGLVIGGVGFFATYVFVTKAELVQTEKTLNGSVRVAEDKLHDIDKRQELTDASVKRLARGVRDVKLEQRVTNENLNKLLRRSRIIPAKREDLRIEIEGEDP